MAEGSDSGGRSGRWKKWLFELVKLLVAAGILVVLFHRIGAGNVWHAFRRLDWRVFVGCVCAYCAMQSMKAYRLKVLLRAIGSRVSYWRLVVIYFIGMFLNTALPTIVGGDAIRVGYLYRETGRIERSVAATLVERVLGVLSLIVIALGALVLAPREHVGPAIVLPVLATSAFFLGGVIGVVSPWAYRVAGAVLKAMRLSRLERPFGKMQRAMALFRRRARALGIALGISFVAQLMVVGIYWLLARGLGLRVPFGFMLMVVPMTVLVSMAPVTVSGLGVREVSWVFLLEMRGVAEADAVTLSLLWFLVVTASSMLGGPAFVLGRSPRRQAQWATSGPCD